MQYVNSVSNMREFILQTDCRGCGRGRRPSLLTRTIIIDLENTGSLSISTSSAQEHISTAMDYPLWTRDSSYDFDGTLPRINGILRLCKECFPKLADNTAVFLYFTCNGFTLNQFLNFFTGNCERNDRLIVKLFRSIFLDNKNKCVKSCNVSCHVQSCTIKYY